MPRKPEEDIKRALKLLQNMSIKTAPVLSAIGELEKALEDLKSYPCPVSIKGEK